MIGNKSTYRRVTVLVTGTALLVLAGCGGEEDVAPTGNAQESAGASDSAIFEGEMIDFVVPYEPGGGYDTYARSLAPYLGECLGAEVVVRNEPGASGLRATITTANAEPDGKRIQITNTVGLVAAQLAEAESMTFDLNDLSWLGRLAAPASVVIVSNDSPFQSFDDILNAAEPVRFVAQGPGSGDYINTNLLAAAYEIPSDVITGFSGAPEARTSVIAGDADAFVSPVDSSFGAIEAGDVRPVVTVGKERDPLLPDVPTVSDTPPESEEGQEALDNLIAFLETGRSVVAPPGMDEERLAALREGMACALADEALLKEFEAQDRPLNPLGGEETAELVAGVLDAPDEFRALVRESF